MKFNSILFIIGLGLLFMMGCNPKAEKQRASNADVEIVILSVNDMHANIDMFPRFAYVVDSLRQVYPDLLLFSAGDNCTGNPANDQYQPANYPMIELMNEVGFDITAVGNHEWDVNIDNLKKNIEQAHFPFVCANVYNDGQLKLDIDPYVFIENQGVKIAILGMIEVRHDDIPGTHPKNLTHLHFKKGMDVIPQYRNLRKQADVFILLSHMGFEEDIEVAKDYPFFDAIIGGHSHTLIEKPGETKGVLITQAGSHLNYATLTKIGLKEGKVVSKNAVTLDLRKGKRIDKKMKALVDGFNDNKALTEPIATALTKFETKEALGYLLTDAIREESGADFAFQNTGGVRVNYLRKGPISVKDVYMIDPFNNEIVVFTMTGKQLKNYIINSYKKNGRIPSYVSGMHYEMQTDGALGVYITPDEKRFSMNDTYTVAMNSYMASTVDFESVDEGRSTFKTSEEMLIDYLRKTKTVDYQGVMRIK